MPAPPPAACCGPPAPPPAPGGGPRPPAPPPGEPLARGPPEPEASFLRCSTNFLFCCSTAVRARFASAAAFSAALALLSASCILF